MIRFNTRGTATMSSSPSGARPKKSPAETTSASTEIPRNVAGAALGSSTRARGDAALTARLRLPETSGRHRRRTRSKTAAEYTARRSEVEHVQGVPDEQRGDRPRQDRRLADPQTNEGESPSTHWPGPPPPENPPLRG